MVDAVITTSQGLFDKKKKNTKNIFLVPNAVNFQLFNQGFTEKVPTQKTIGYVGNLDSRIAIDALEEAIQTLGNCQFEFAGVVSEKTYKERLEKYSNVTFLGTFHPSQLPGILNKWAVGIIPFVKNDFTRGVYPLKINENLAVGLPVVSTRFSVIEGFNHIVNFVEEESQLTSAIEESIEQDNEQKHLERNAFAALQTWENRVDLFSKYIEKVEEN